jgi:hypothetical protein
MLHEAFFNVVTTEKQKRHIMPTFFSDLQISKLCLSINQSQRSSGKCNTKLKSLNSNEISATPTAEHW